MTTINEIAKRAGVGVGTVSRYLNNNPHLSDEKRDKIATAIKELHYTPSAIATQLRVQATKNIGFLVSRIANPFFSALFDAVELELNAHGYQVMVAQTHTDAAAEQRFLSQLRSRQLDGVILASVENASYVADVAKEFPDQLILLNEQIDDSEVHTIVLDHYQATLDALAYLFDQGHRKIAYATGGDFPSQHHGQSRTLAYQDFLAQHQLPLNEQLIFSKQHTLQDGLALGQHLTSLPEAERPDAIFANSDEVATGLIQALLTNDIKVPDQLAVIGYDDQPMAAFTRVPLTTIHQPIAEMAHAAVAQLLAGLNHEPRPALPSLQLPLVIRESA